jgi:2,3,4,5-tetrahydropyridine-2-carboxylate N-succinyltransferase
MSVKNRKFLEEKITTLFEERELLKKSENQDILIDCLRLLEKGELRVCSPSHHEADCGAVPISGDLKSWKTHAWVKKIALLAFSWRQSQKITFSSDQKNIKQQGRIHAGEFSYNDKFDMRQDLDAVRIVPPGTVREGAHVQNGAIIMPSYVNIAAWVGKGTLVDTWATVGSCAQVGESVHLSGGVGLGGVLEPPNANPVIIGDGAFIGSRSIIVEGAIIGEKAVLGANVCITASTPIYDMTKSKPVEYRGYVPPYAVVVPGTRPKKLKGGEIQIQCAFIISYRDERLDEKLSLNDALREIDS